MQLVLIGSSAGGIEALTRLVADLPGDFGARSSSPSTSTRGGRATSPRSSNATRPFRSG